MSHVGARIEEMMIKAGLKQKQLAPLIGRQNSTVSNWINGRRSVKVDEVEKVANALKPRIGDCTFYLLTGKHEEDHIKAFNLNDAYIAKREVLSNVQEFLIEMESLRQVVILGDLSNMLEAFASQMNMGSEKVESGNSEAKGF